jgi:hypothetical protein
MYPESILITAVFACAGTAASRLYDKFNLPTFAYPSSRKTHSHHRFNKIYRVARRLLVVPVSLIGVATLSSQSASSLPIPGFAILLVNHSRLFIGSFDFFSRNCFNRFDPNLAIWF